MCKCRGISSYIAKYFEDRDTYTYITEIDKNLGECTTGKEYLLEQIDDNCPFK
jgi:hypothetical protein